MTLALYLFLGRTFYGRAIMAVSQDQPALRLMGANPVQIKTIAFGVGIAAASLAGALLITHRARDPVHRPRLHRPHVRHHRPRRHGQHRRHARRRRRLGSSRASWRRSSARRGRWPCPSASCCSRSPSGRPDSSGARCTTAELGRSGWSSSRPAIGLAALRLNPYLYFAGYVILQYVVIATAWNILGGYAGYVNFGTPAFFAIGAYTASSSSVGEGAAAGADPRRRPRGRLLGWASAISRCACAARSSRSPRSRWPVVLQTVIINWEYVGGSRGLSVIRPSGPPFGNYVVFSSR
jgi:hypothetical protein